jgi:hypothetical protein
MRFGERLHAPNVLKAIIGVAIRRVLARRYEALSCPFGLSPMPRQHR